ncbi:hypothetical protein BYT27DRAFT_7210740 [Phlegmacium glaucopus]|nr:hypothetical protein BYT27DRAFT_7210740 [Phlegmacium glaucopus]
MYSKIFVSALFSLPFAFAAVATVRPHLGKHQASGIGSLVEITAIGGKAITIITSEGGEAFTLAEAGVVTSVFGTVVTVATRAVATRDSDLVTIATTAVGSVITAETNGAFVPYVGVQTSLLVGLGSVIVGAFLGAVITL